MVHMELSSSAPSGAVAQLRYISCPLLCNKLARNFNSLQQQTFIVLTVSVAQESGQVLAGSSDHGFS
jgi:hypothetical protein